MLTFTEYLTEAKAEKSSVSSNTKGVMHEILVGYHLNGGKHMEKHGAEDGSTPQQVHDNLKSTISDKDYDLINRRAKAAAEDIRARVGHPIKHVHWTSKPGDLERSTGIVASQKEDPSDIVITDKKGTHHGVSLKVSDSKDNVPVSNPGMDATFGAQKILDAHRENVMKAVPALRQAKNKAERKEIIKNDPKAAAAVKARNAEVLNNIADHMHKQMSNLNTQDLANHIRHRILHAHPTPMQAQGHNHIRHTAYETKTGTQFKAINPHKDYDHILNDHKNLGVQRSGTSIIFTHKGVPFAKHRIKFESQSDPLSSVKGSGEEVPMKKTAVQKPAAPVSATPQKKSKAQHGGLDWRSPTE